MEEIDIIELLKRVKEGNAPKEIEIGSIFYRLVPEFVSYSMEYWYEDEKENSWKIEEYSLDTKIKILDKPIIEELDEIELKGLNDEIYIKLVIKNTRDKINEIIRYLRSKDER